MKKFKNLFLILGAILFIMPFTSCDTSSTNSESISQQESETSISNSGIVSLSASQYEEDDIYTYIKVDYNELTLEGNYHIVDNSIYLNKYSQHKEQLSKYDETFFESNKLIVFNIVENSYLGEFKFESYEIENDELFINIKTIRTGDVAVMEQYVVLVEVTSGEIENIDRVNIIKNNTDISKTLNEMKSKYMDIEVRDTFPNAKTYESRILDYYGCYNGAYVVVLANNYFEYLTVVIEEKIEDLVFYYDNPIRVYYDNDFHSLTQSYDIGKLAYDDLVKIYNYRYK